MRVSVVIPCHDSARFLPDVIASVLAQSVRDYEIVLVDDGSRDDTRRVCDDIIAAHRDRAMTLVAQANPGVAAARNAGIAVARAACILPLDAMT